jgi:subtilisin family serine protease
MLRIVRVCALGSCVLILASCGGGSSAPSPPVVTATANVSQGQAPLTVNFDASKSMDPQNLPLTYTWTVSDGSASATGPTISHVFRNHGNYTATVAVSDGQFSGSKTLAISVTAAPPTVQPTTTAANVMGVSPTSIQAMVSATDREGLTLTYTLATPPTIGSATVVASTGAITYTVPDYTTAASDSFTVKVANGFTSATGTVTVALNGDPLLPNQWHIQNTGQDAFASVFPVASNDMNVTGAWTTGYSGKNIKVAVVDTGLEATHEDLAANVDVTRSFNFLTGLSDPSRLASDPGFDHGTSVAGIIGAVAFNGKGGRGIAYNARLRGYNLIAPGAFSVANMAKSFGSDRLSADADMFNASFGVSAPALPPFSGAFQAISATSLTLRGGLGAAIVNAAGNDFNDWEAMPNTGLCAAANHYGVSCGDPANDERRGGYTPIIVGAINANGKHSSYSDTGSSLWITAPGGEYGLNSSYAPGFSNYDPAIITTSRTGCANALYPPAKFPNGVNGLDSNGANSSASSCQYTAVMNGTSSATPNTTGTVAMMLEANPNLSVRDIKYILAKTAKRVDPTFAGISATDIVPGATVVLEQGWVTNAGGYTFSNWYGFGGVDATAAVTMAKSYTAYLPTLKSSTGNYKFTAAAPATIPPQSVTGGFINYSVAESFNTAEFVVVFVSIDSTPGMQCNQIELTSPTGTKSILMHAANGFANTSVANSRFLSNAFYGEAVNGTWTLRFLDFCAASGTSTQLSTTVPQVLLIAGH